MIGSQFTHSWFHNWGHGYIQLWCSPLYTHYFTI